MWINRIVLKRFEPFDNLPEMDDLPEMEEMIGERIDIWKRELKREAKREGREEGREEGGCRPFGRYLQVARGPGQEHRPAQSGAGYGQPELLSAGDHRPDNVFAHLRGPGH